MKREKRKYIVISLIIVSLVLLVTFNLYKEAYGYPWEHKEIKKEAITYMKEKYDMNVIVVESSYNFKFDYYTARVYNINDENKKLISVEKQRAFDENGQSREKG